MESYDPFADFGTATAGPRDSGPAIATTAGPAESGYGVAPTRGDTEAALRSRLNAAIIDQILVGVMTAVVALVLRLSFESLGVAAVAIPIEMVYFFVQESRTGQTVGKRQYGVRVVSLDGTRPGPRAIAFRTLGRILDALPAYHASGLLTMIGTGRRRRQRIGDMIARTTVVAAPGGRPLARPLGWLLPVLTLVATALSAAVIVAAVHNANANSLRAGFLRGCEQAGSTTTYCGCVYDTLAAAGYTTTGAWESLERDVDEARLTGDRSVLPGAYVAAIRGCGAP